MGKGKIWPLATPKPFNWLSPNLHRWLRRVCLPSAQFLSRSVWRFFLRMRDSLPVASKADSAILGFFRSPTSKSVWGLWCGTAKTPTRSLTRRTRQKTRFRARMCVFRITKPKLKIQTRPSWKLPYRSPISTRLWIFSPANCFKIGQAHLWMAL